MAAQIILPASHPKLVQNPATLAATSLIVGGTLLVTPSGAPPVPDPVTLLIWDGAKSYPPY